MVCARVCAIMHSLTLVHYRYVHVHNHGISKTSMLLQDIKETKRYGHTFVRSFGRTHGRENSIPSHKHSFVGNINSGTYSIDNNEPGSS